MIYNLPDGFICSQKYAYRNWFAGIGVGDCVIYAHKRCICIAEDNGRLVFKWN